MRSLTVILLFLQFSRVAAALSIDPKLLINKEWIGPGGEYLRITADSAQLETGRDYIKCPYHVAGNVLILTYYQTIDSFIIDELSERNLSLRSFKKKNAAIFGLRARETSLWSGDPVVFAERNALISPSFKFQKVYYASTGGWSPCRTQVSIDSAGVVVFAASGCGKFNGTYKGQLSPAQLNDLSKMVNNAMPERFALPCCAEDGGSVCFRFYYNNKVKEIRGQYPTPYLAHGLAKFLTLVPDNIPLEKISDRTEME